MRISLTNPPELINGKGKYQRRAFIRVLDEGEAGDDNRLAALKVVKEFLEQYNNNKYGTTAFKNDHAGGPQTLGSTLSLFISYHVQLTLEACQRRGLAVQQIFLSGGKGRSLVEKTNLAILRRMTGRPVTPVPPFKNAAQRRAWAIKYFAPFIRSLPR